MRAHSQPGPPPRYCTSNQQRFTKPESPRTSQRRLAGAQTQLPVLFALRYPEDPATRRFRRLFDEPARDDTVQLEAMSILEQMHAFEFADRVRDDEVRVALNRVKALGHRGFDTSGLEKVMGSI